MPLELVVELEVDDDVLPEVDEVVLPEVDDELVEPDDVEPLDEEDDELTHVPGVKLRGFALKHKGSEVFPQSDT